MLHIYGFIALIVVPMTVITGWIDGSRSENRSSGSSFKSRSFIFRSAHQAGGIDGPLDNFPAFFHLH